MYLKTAVILAWFAASYVLLVFFASIWWLGLIAATLLGIAMAAIGFNVQHDGGHRAYSSRPWVNRLMAMSLDLMGGSSYLWARKHNGIHHSYANITGHDDDIDLGIIGRLSPHQAHLPFHRMQHFYMWLLYGFLPAKWQLYDDFRDYIRGSVGGKPYPRPKGWDLALFVGGKAAFFALALVVPLLLHPLWIVLLFYLAASLVQGVLLGVVFQMAHCVEEAAFPMPSAETGRMESSWAVHQLETTVDFARDSRVLSWLVGGLADFPDRTPSVSGDLPYPLSAAGAIGRANLPRIWLEVHDARELVGQHRLALPLAAADGRAERELKLRYFVLWLRRQGLRAAETLDDVEKHRRQKHAE